jgi:hypothetical protein
MKSAILAVIVGDSSKAIARFRSCQSRVDSVIFMLLPVLARSDFHDVARAARVAQNQGLFLPQCSMIRLNKELAPDGLQRVFHPTFLHPTFPG